MNDDDFKRERRKQRRLEALGTQDPNCSVCPECRWQCLELHHVADHGVDPRTVIACANCHKILTDAQKDHPPHEDEVADPMLERIGRFLLGLADLLKLAVEALKEFGLELIARAADEVQS